MVVVTDKMLEKNDGGAETKVLDMDIALAIKVSKDISTHHLEPMYYVGNK